MGVDAPELEMGVKMVLNSNTLACNPIYNADVKSRSRTTLQMNRDEGGSRTTLQMNRDEGGTLPESINNYIREDERSSPKYDSEMTYDMPKWRSK
ncbi:hypothetical protein SUGI_0750450 [Cryptomeria japonica]|nr:hypothetical protein SUGI_0750450 [Cryptomeria japonica]